MMISQVPLTAKAAKGSPLRKLPQQLQAQVARLILLGAIVLLELAAAGSSLLSSLTTASLRPRFPCKAPLDLYVCECDDPALDLYAPGRATNSSSSTSAAAACTAGKTSAGQRLQVAPKVPAAAAAAAAASVGPGTPPHQCRRRRTSLLWTIPE